MNQTVEVIRQVFHPNPYPVCEEPIAGTLLHLSRASVAGAKYALLVAEVDKDTDIPSLIAARKATLKRHYRANWMRGVGVVLIFLGPESAWRDKVAAARPDRHGLRSVILQGVLFLDPGTGAYELGQSQWGPIKFGNFQGQMDKVHELLGRLTDES